jgi:hypothetical protein
LATLNVLLRAFSEIDFDPTAELVKRVFERENSFVLCLIYQSVQAKQSPQDLNPAGEHRVPIRRSQIDGPLHFGTTDSQLPPRRAKSRISCCHNYARAIMDRQLVVPTKRTTPAASCSSAPQNRYGMQISFLTLERNPRCYCCFYRKLSAPVAPSPQESWGGDAERTK